MAKFDPATIRRYSVIEAPFTFPGKAVPEVKRFIVLAHGDKGLICIKPTSQLGFYRANPGLLNGCIQCPAGTLKVFPKETIIPVDQTYSVPYASIKDQFSVKARMPQSFHAAMLEAIKKSPVMSDEEREITTTLIGNGN